MIYSNIYADVLNVSCLHAGKDLRLSQGIFAKGKFTLYIFETTGNKEPDLYSFSTYFSLFFNNKINLEIFCFSGETQQ